MVSSEIDESIFHHIEMMFSKTTFEFRRDGLEKALVKVLSEKEIIHINEILNRIFFELLHSDLSDVIYPTFPNLNEFQNGYVAQNGPILLEIVECIEVGVSTYKLLQILNEFESSQAKNAEREDGLEKKLVFPRKMLYLLLSDGQQQIKGMEYKQIPELSLHTPIGKKVLISNVKYTENMLFLTPGNTYVCEGFEWTSRRLGDLKSTFMELLGMAINENIEDESQISYNALHPCDVQPDFSPSNIDGGLARVIFNNVPNMPDLTKLKRFLLKAETSNPPPRSVPSNNETLRRDSIVRTSSCPEPTFKNPIQLNPISRVDSTFNNSMRCNSVARATLCPEPANNSTRFNSMSRALHPESSFNNINRPNSVTKTSYTETAFNSTERPNSLARTSSYAEPPFNDSMRTNANEEEQPSYMSSRLRSRTKSSFTKPTFKAPLRQFNVDTPLSTQHNPSSKSLYNEPAFKSASSWNKPVEETEPTFRTASTLYNNQEATPSTEPASKKPSTSYNSPPIEENIEPSYNHRPSYNNTSRSHLSISSNEPDFNVSPIRPNSRSKETESKISYSIHSNPGIDPFSIQDDDFSYMLVEDDPIPNNIDTRHNNDKNQNQDFFNDFHNDDVVLIDSDCDLPPVEDLCHIRKDNVITESKNNSSHISEEDKNKLASLFESLENEYKIISSEPDSHLPPAHNLRNDKNNLPNDNKKRSWLYEEIDCDNDMDGFELPPAKRVNLGTDDDHERKSDGESLANPIVLDYDDKDYEMDLDEILSGYTFEC